MYIYIFFASFDSQLTTLKIEKINNFLQGTYLLCIILSIANTPILYNQ